LLQHKQGPNTSGNGRVEWEKKVIKQKGKLKGNRATEKIFIDNDLTKKERKIQEKIRAIAREEKKKGKM
jgi:hypothetical protein